MKCKCIYEPRGDHGLEGYVLGEIYSCEYRQDKDGAYWRVFPTGSHVREPNKNPAYYETCGPIIFVRYFVIIKEVHNG